MFASLNDPDLCDVEIWSWTLHFKIIVDLWTQLYHFHARKTPQNILDCQLSRNHHVKLHCWTQNYGLEWISKAVNLNYISYKNNLLALAHLTQEVLKKQALDHRFQQAYCNNQSMGKAAAQTLHKQLFCDKLTPVET